MFVLVFPSSDIAQPCTTERASPLGIRVCRILKKIERNLMSSDYGVVESVLLKKVNIMINNLGLCN